MVKNLPAKARDTGSVLWVGMIFCRRKWQPTPVFLPGKSHGRGRLAGFSPCVRAKSLQSCPTLCDPMDCSSSVHGIPQARILEWLAISFPDLGIEPGSPALQADSLPAEVSCVDRTL